MRFSVNKYCFIEHSIGLTKDHQEIGVIAGSISAVAIVVALVTIGAVIIMCRWFIFVFNHRMNSIYIVFE